MNSKLAGCLLCLFFLTTIGNAATNKEESFTHHPLYIGGIGGYGSTTWSGLVPDHINLNEAISLSTPTSVEEGGGVWGVFTGYEILPHFAVEFTYLKYPNAQIFFDPDSLFSFLNNDLTTFSTATETLNLMGKIMMQIPTTPLKLYSSIGVATIHRNDLLLNTWRWTPTFGAGINANLTEHIMAEIDGNYTAGFGESQLNPTNTFIPFLYAITFRLAYCFG